MDPSQEPQAYGAGRAGTPFNLVEFLKTPQVILRILAWVTRRKDGILRDDVPLLFVCRCLRLLSSPVSPKKDFWAALAVTIVPVPVVTRLRSVWSHFSSPWSSRAFISIFRIFPMLADVKSWCLSRWSHQVISLRITRSMPTDWYFTRRYLDIAMVHRLLLYGWSMASRANERCAWLEWSEQCSSSFGLYLLFHLSLGKALWSTASLDFLLLYTGCIDILRFPSFSPRRLESLQHELSRSHSERSS